MGKALMVATLGGNLGSGDELNAFGFISVSATEAHSQVSATEGCTFSGLGFNYISGASGTANTLQFRDAGANGNQVATRNGQGFVEDTTNSDVLTAGDLFNLAYTDNGTDAGGGWIKMNVAMASGHGNFHGSISGGAVHDIQSATRFICLAGALPTDGSATEELVTLRNRAYDTIAAFQVYVRANARTNDSVFKFRSGNADVAGTTITYAAAETGLKTVTGLSAAIADGADIGASLTLLTGVEDLTVTFVVATLKSSTNKSDCWAHAGSGGLARAASATEHFFPIGGRIIGTTTFTEAQSRIKPGFAATISHIRIYCSANTYGADGTLTLYKNGVSMGTRAITASGGAAWYENTASLGDISATDELSWGIVGGTSGSITINAIGLTFSPVAAGGGGGAVFGGEGRAVFSGVGGVVH